MNNLYGLYDCLTDISEEKEITIVYYDILDYRENAIINTFLDAVEENDSLYVLLQHLPSE